MSEWLCEELPGGAVVGADPFLSGAQQWLQMQATLLGEATRQEPECRPRYIVRLHARGRMRPRYIVRLHARGQMQATLHGEATRQGPDAGHVTW